MYSGSEGVYGGRRMLKYASTSLCPRAGFVTRPIQGFRSECLLPHALRGTLAICLENIPLELHTRRAPDGGVETVEAIIEGAAIISSTHALQRENASDLPKSE